MTFRTTIYLRGMKMQETNDYGMYSGGYIFDQMDRAALFYVKQEGKLPDNAVIVTQAVDGVRFKRQLCDKYNVTVHCFDFHVIELFSKLYTCKAEVIDNKGHVVAEASFVFTETTNHCALDLEFDTSGNGILDTRCINVLKNAHIKTIDDITRLSKEDIRKMPNAGPRTVNRIEYYLKSFGLSLRKEITITVKQK